MPAGVLWISQQAWDVRQKTFTWVGAGLDGIQQQFERTYTTHVRTDVDEALAASAIEHPVRLTCPAAMLQPCAGVHLSPSRATHLA